VEPAAHDLRAAAHIQQLTFSDVSEPVLTFGGEPTA
jgi:hypothetical protein